MSNIVDIYGLTPAQEGIYFQYALNPASKTYHLQFLLRLKHSADPEIFGKAIRLLSLRHDVLRSAFAVSASTGNIKQIVLKNRYANFQKISFNEKEDDKKLREIVEHDADKPFDLQKDHLLRTILVTFSDAQYVLASTHHIIVDGWSIQILANDVERFYKELSSGCAFEELEEKILKEQSLSTHFCEYVKWVKTAGNDETKAYWKNLFRDYADSGNVSEKQSENDKWFGSENLQLDKELTAEFEAVASAENITVNTLFEAALAVALQKESNSDDVVFAKVVSGRNAKLKNIFECVGLFLNTIPVRVTFENLTDTKELLQNIHKQSAMADRYGFLSLSEICRITPLRQNAIKVLLAFENYPFNYSEGTVGFELVENRGQTGFDITLTVIKNSYGYNVEAVSFPNCNAQAENLLKDLKAELINIVENHTLNFVRKEEENTTRNKEPEKNEFFSPESDMERMVCDKFSEILHISPISMNTDFFFAGGSSIDVISFISDERFKNVSASEFIANPTPAGICAVLKRKSFNKYKYLQPLFIPNKSTRTLVLFPYAGGNAESYSELIPEIRKRMPDTAVYFVRFLHSVEECLGASEEIKDLKNPGSLYFYAHCIGDSIAIQMIDFIEENKKTVECLIVGANIPPEKPLKHNWWNIIPDFVLKKVLIKAGSRIGDLSDSQSKEILRLFRKDADSFTDFFKARIRKISAPIYVIINKNDIFTTNHKDAGKNWQKYTTNEVSVRYIESDTHYFQSKNADVLAEMIAEIIGG